MNGAKVGQVILFALLLIFWVVWLAGIGATEDVCVGEISSVRDCGMRLSLEWWVLFLELLCITLGILVAFVSSMSARFDGTVIIFFTIATTLMCITANTSVRAAYDNEVAGIRDRNSRAYDAMAAGNVGLLIFNFIYLILLTDRHSSLRNEEPTPSYNNQPKQPEPVYGTAGPVHQVAVARV